MDALRDKIVKERNAVTTLLFLVEEVQSAHKFLDELGVPREDGNTPDGFSLVGRIKRIPRQSATSNINIQSADFTTTSAEVPITFTGS